MLKLIDGKIKRVDEPALTALNMRLRDDYTNDCNMGVARWNKIIEATGIQFELAAAARGVPPPYRRISPTSRRPRPASCWTRPNGTKMKDDFLPSDADGDFIEGLMRPVVEPRQIRELDRAAQGRHR